MPDHTIKGQPFIGAVEVFWNQGGLISVRQVDEWGEDAIVVVDKTRAMELIEALQSVVEDDEPASDNATS